MLPAPSPPLKILVAEDNLLNQMVFVQMLAELGHQARGVRDGLEVLQALQQQTYNLVFMDVCMPKLDGLAATRQIRQLLPVAQQPFIIALTGGGSPAEIQEYQTAGMNAFLSKPVDMIRLAQAIDQHVTCNRLGVESVETMTVFSATVFSATSPNAADTVLDPEALAEIRAVAEDEADDFLITVIDTYLETAATLLPQLLAASTGEHWSVVREAAHSLKSMSAQLGARTLVQICQKLEALTRAEMTPGPEAITQLTTQLKAEYPHVQQALIWERQRIWEAQQG